MSYSPAYNYSLCSEHQILSFSLRLNFHFTPWIATLVPMCFCMLWGKRLKITELSAVSKAGVMKVSYLFSPSVSLCVGQSRQPQQKSHFFFPEFIHQYSDIWVMQRSWWNFSVYLSPLFGGIAWSGKEGHEVKIGVLLKICFLLCHRGG